MATLYHWGHGLGIFCLLPPDLRIFFLFSPDMRQNKEASAPAKIQKMTHFKKVSGLTAKSKRAT